MTDPPAAGTGGSTALLAFMLLVLLVVVLRRQQRRQALQPAVLLLLALPVLLLEQVAVGSLAALLAPIALFLLYGSIVRSAFLLIVTTLPRLLPWQFQKIYLDIVMALAWVAIGLAALRVAEIEPRELFTGTAVITLLVGLALKSTLGSIFAGLAIQIHRPFDVGDWIRFDDRREHIGKVRESNWRATTVVTLDEVEVIIPSHKLAEAPLTNFNRPQRWARRSIFFVCPYSAPPREVQQIVVDAIPGSFGVLENPAPSVVTHAFTERGVEYWLRFFTIDLDQRNAVDSAARTRIWYALNRRGIQMPNSRQHVRLREPTSAADHPGDEPWNSRAT